MWFAPTVVRGRWWRLATICSGLGRCSLRSVFETWIDLPRPWLHRCIGALGFLLVVHATTQNTCFTYLRLPLVGEHVTQKPINKVYHHQKSLSSADQVLSNITCSPQIPQQLKAQQISQQCRLWTEFFNYELNWIWIRFREPWTELNLSSIQSSVIVSVQFISQLAQYFRFIVDTVLQTLTPPWNKSAPVQACGYSLELDGLN